MIKATGKKDVIKVIDNENKEKIEIVLEKLKVKRRSEEIYKALIDRLEYADKQLFEHLGNPQLENPETVEPLIKLCYDVSKPRKGTFLKLEKAIQMLEKTPPPNIMKAFGYKNVNELLEKEDLFEVYSALRFMESREWMNTIFIKHYKTLTPKDFEQRDIKTIVLPVKWLKVGEKFVEKKYHNLSHLKELGVIFIIPIKIDAPGELSTVLTLLLHYINEVQFYSRLIVKYMEDEKSFSQKLISFIRGDVGEAGLADINSNLRWLIVQRYLSKDYPVDPRLFLNHVNPEAIHWGKATDQITSCEEHLPVEEFGLTLWHDLDYVGGFFPTSEGGRILLVSFDLVDNIMTLVKKIAVKHLYHQQEALWNRIYTGYMGEKGFDNVILDNLDKGYIEIK